MNKISEKARECGMLIEGLAERSRQMFKKGLRSGKPWPTVTLEGRTYEPGEYLLSSYCSAQFSTVTTADDVWLMLTEELPGKLGERARKNHARNATMFTSVIGPPSAIRDGQHRHNRGTP